MQKLNQILLLPYLSRLFASNLAEYLKMHIKM